MKKTYDLRSDTVTLPTDEMRRAMAAAELGDDVYGEDPTVNRLEAKAAELAGKEAALFVSSGSMGNLIPLYLNCGRGNEVICHSGNHIMHYELASVAAIAGVLPVGIEGERGILRPEAIEARIRPTGIYYMARTRMVEIENTHNTCGGSCWSLEELAAVRDLASRHGLFVHMDGARIFNAAVARGYAVAEAARHVDTMTFCLSKGLGAPVGSLLCGTVSFIAEARRVRKMLGGGMRQAGVLAAAGLFALAHNVERLAEDHANAKRLYRTLKSRSWAGVDAAEPETNILYFEAIGGDAAGLVARLRERGILGGSSGPTKVRLVTSLAVRGRDFDELIALLETMSS